MLAIIQAQPRYLGTIYSLIRELAKHEGILDKIQISEQQLGALLFGTNPYHSLRTMEGRRPRCVVRDRLRFL